MRSEGSGRLLYRSCPRGKEVDEDPGVTFYSASIPLFYPYHKRLERLIRWSRVRDIYDPAPLVGLERGEITEHSNFVQFFFHSSRHFWNFRNGDLVEVLDCSLPGPHPLLGRWSCHR